MGCQVKPSGKNYYIPPGYESGQFSVSFHLKSLILKDEFIPAYLITMFQYELCTVAGVTIVIPWERGGGEARNHCGFGDLLSWD